MLSRKEREREFKKQLIAEAAFQLFKNSSFESVTVQDIASAAECGKGTIYQYFATKEEILYYILSESQERLIKNIEAQCSLENDALQALFNYLNLQYEYHCSCSPLVISLYRRRMEGSIEAEGYYARLIEKRDRRIRAVTELIKRGIEQDLIMEVDSHKMALILNNIVRGFCLGNLELDPTDVDEAADLRLIKDILVKGIVTEEGGSHLE